jgi:hypothetical protein
MNYTGNTQVLETKLEILNDANVIVIKQYFIF